MRFLTQLLRDKDLGPRAFAHGWLIPAHVEKDAIDRLELLQDLARLLGEVVLVRRGHVQNLPLRETRPKRLPPDAPAVRLDAHPLRMGVGRELFGMRKDGVAVPVEIALTPIELDRRPAVLAVTRKR